MAGLKKSTSGSISKTICHFCTSRELAGPFCESGDILIENLPLPPLAPGELVAVPASGAYHLAMGSNYNGARKPAVLWVAQGEAHLIQRRETLDDLVRRDVPLSATLAATL
ncbi:MAG: hypothetical protein WDZ49_16025 [Litorilinea sp.]